MKWLNNVPYEFIFWKSLMGALIGFDYYSNRKERLLLVKLLHCCEENLSRYGLTTPCIVFGETQQTGTSTAVASITAHIKAKRCGCEVNNP